MFPACQHDPTGSDHVHFGNGVADDRKGILANLTIGGDIVRRVDVAIIDLLSWNELIDLYGPRALNLLMAQTEHLTRLKRYAPKTHGTR